LINSLLAKKIAPAINIGRRVNIVIEKSIKWGVGSQKTSLQNKVHICPL